MGCRHFLSTPKLARASQQQRRPKRHGARAEGHPTHRPSDAAGMRARVPFVAHACRTHLPLPSPFVPPLAPPHRAGNGGGARAGFRAKRPRPPPLPFLVAQPPPPPPPPPPRHAPRSSSTASTRALSLLLWLKGCRWFSTHTTRASPPPPPPPLFLSLTPTPFSWRPPPFWPARRPCHPPLLPPAPPPRPGQTR